MWKTIEVKGHSALAKEIINWERKGYNITYKLDGIRYVLVKGKSKAVVQIVRI